MIGRLVKKPEETMNGPDFGICNHSTSVGFPTNFPKYEPFLNRTLTTEVGHELHADKINLAVLI